MAMGWDGRKLNHSTYKGFRDSYFENLYNVPWAFCFEHAHAAQQHTWVHWGVVGVEWEPNSNFMGPPQFNLMVRENGHKPWITLRRIWEIRHRIANIILFIDHDVTFGGARLTKANYRITIKVFCIQLLCVGTEDWIIILVGLDGNRFRV